MMTPSSELGFDCKPFMQPTQKLEEFLALLEEERLKIDAFKRELPLCMQLLNNAVEASRQQLQSQRSMNDTGRPVLEEFIPLKNTSSNITADQNNNTSSDKANWMTCAQLWNQESVTRTPSPKEHNDHMKIALNHEKQRVINGGAFVPFSSKDRKFTPFPELALASSVSQKEEMGFDSAKNSLESNSRANNSGVTEKELVHGAANTTSQAQRKARRCWSPDLHRRFVNALQMLGGSQLATPKQIRELMKVDGLTNDEVKSHLQKYRLHTRRPSPNSQTTPGTPQVVVLGGIWVPPEYAAAAAAHGGAQATTLFGPHVNTAHHVSPVFCSAPPQVSHEIYPAIGAPPSRHMHHHQLHVYNKPTENNSPDSDTQGGAEDQSESIEDGKSESGSWKADSGGENGGERRKPEGEESNASVFMSLKF